MKTNHVTNSDNSRQAVLQSWLDENSLTRRSLSRWIGIDPSYLTHILAGKRNCTRRIRADLESVGFPLHLIPAPRYRRKANTQPNTQPH